MIWAILFYYLFIFITIYLWWVIFFRSYHTTSRISRKGSWEEGDKLKFPMWQIIVFFILTFVPAINVFLFIAEIILISDLKDTKDAEFRSFLFKKY